MTKNQQQEPELDITTEEILNMDIKTLWKTTQIIKQQTNNKQTLKHIEQTKQGTRIPVLIWYFTEEWYEIYPESKKVRIRGHGKYQLEDFMQEKEHREQTMRTLLINHIETKGITKGRT